MSSADDAAEREAEAFANGDIDVPRQSPAADIHRQAVPPDAGVADTGYDDMDRGSPVTPDVGIVDAGVPPIAGVGPSEGTVLLGGVIMLHPDPETLRLELMQYTIAHGALGLGQVKDMLDEQAGVAASNPEQYDGNANWGYNSAALVQQVHANAAPIIDSINAQIADIRRTFEAQAYINANIILDGNEKQARGEALRYGLSQNEMDVPLATETDFDNEDIWYNMAESSETTRLAAAAKVLLDRRNAIDDKINQYFESYGYLDTWESDLRVMVDEYDRLRGTIITRFPILGAFSRVDDDKKDELRRIASGPSSDVAWILGIEIRTKMQNILKVRANLYDPSAVNIWRLENLVAATMVQLGWDEDPLKKVIIDETVWLARPGRFEAIAQAVFNAVALILAPFTAGVSLWIAAGVNAYVAYEHVQDYLMQKALSGTAFDKAQALTSYEPSLFWLAVEIVGVVLDFGAAIAAMKAVAPVVKTAQVAAEGEAAVEAMEAARNAARAEGGGILAERVEAGIKAAREGRDIELEAAGATKAELEELGAAGRAAEKEMASGEVGEAMATPAGGKVRVSKTGEVWMCSSPCTILRGKYPQTFATDPELLTELERIEQNAQRAAQVLKDAEAAGDAAKIREAEALGDSVKQDALDLENLAKSKHPELQGPEASAQSVEAMKEVEAEAQVTKGRLNPAKMDAPPPPRPANLTAEQEELFAQYEDYYRGRYDALQGKLPPGAEAVKPPLSWSAYSDFLGKFRRGTSFQRSVQEGLEAEADLRRMGFGSDESIFGGKDPIFGDMEMPVVEQRGNVGVAGKEATDPTVKYVDQLVYDEASLGTAEPKVVSVSNKSRVFPEGKLSEPGRLDLEDQVISDATEAVEKYGGTVNVRRPTSPFFDTPIEISSVVLVYDARFVTPEVEAVIRDTLEYFWHDGQSVTVVFR